MCFVLCCARVCYRKSPWLPIAKRRRNWSPQRHMVAGGAWGKVSKLMAFYSVLGSRVF
jgi:hypothetical protein